MVWITIEFLASTGQYSGEILYLQLTSGIHPQSSCQGKWCWASVDRGRGDEQVVRGWDIFWGLLAFLLLWTISAQLSDWRCKSRGFRVLGRPGFGESAGFLGFLWLSAVPHTPVYTSLDAFSPDLYFSLTHADFFKYKIKMSGLT